MKHADRQLRREVSGLGFEIVREKGHIVWRHRNGQVLVTPASIGRGRAFANSLALARRIAREA